MMMSYAGCEAAKAQRGPLARAVVLASVLVLAIVLVLSATQIYATRAYAQTERAADFYAVLHEDGSLVFQAAPSSNAGDVNYAGSLSGYDGEWKVPWGKAADKVTSISFSSDFKSIQPRDLTFWFWGMSKAVTIDVTNLDTSKATTLRSLFEGCSSLVEIVGLDTFDTSACTRFGSMFSGCSSLKSLDLKTFDATHVTVMCYLFRNCSSLETLDVSGPGWNTAALNGAVNAFEGCSSLKRVDLSSWNTSRMVTFYHGFTDCTSLEYVDFSSFDTSVMHSFIDIFKGCPNLKTVKVGDKFSFCGDGSTRICHLPQGHWQSSVDGAVYASEEIPNNIAATYTRMTDEEYAAYLAKAQEAAADTPAAVGDESKAGSSGKDGEGNARKATAGKTVSKSGATYRLVSASKAVLVKAPASKKKFTLPASVKVGGKSCAVVGIAKSAFKGSKVVTLTIKSKKLSKQQVKSCFKGAKKLKVVKVPKSKKAAYAKLFKKSMSGKAVSVK